VTRLTTTFNQRVVAGEAAFQLVRRDGGAQAVSVTNPSGDGRTYVLTFGGALPDGVYELSVRASEVRYTRGGAVVMAPPPYVFVFHVLAGDVNGDRAVNGTDFAILAGNFGKAGMTHLQGDLNGDERVDGSDFAMLAGNFGKRLEAEPRVQAAAVTAAAALPPKAQHPQPRRQPAKARSVPTRRMPQPQLITRRARVSAK
jgi:hypothetical protein